MTIPEYDQECNCDMCVSLRNKRRIKEEIEKVHAEHKTSTGTDLLEDCFR